MMMMMISIRRDLTNPSFHEAVAQDSVREEGHTDRVGGGEERNDDFAVPTVLQ